VSENKLLHRVRGANPEQVAVLLQGVDTWNRWRAENPEVSIELSEIDLRPESIAGHPVLGGSGASLRKINFRGAVLRDARLEGADLYGATLDDAYLGGVHFEGATLQDATLERATLTGAHLQDASLAWANLKGANLQGANLDGAGLRHADLREADLRGIQKAVFDESKIVHAVTGLAAKDPWSVLRRKYTGVMLFFHLLFLVAFILPYAGRAFLWKAVNRGQSLYTSASSEALSDMRRLEWEKVKSKLAWREKARLELEQLKLETKVIERLEQIVADGVEAELGGLQGNAVREVSRKLEKVGPCLREDCVETPAWRVLFQLDRGPVAAFLVITLAAYNLLRALVTWQVGLMRDEEERSGITPPWRAIRLHGRIRWWLPFSFVKRMPGPLQKLFLRDTTFVQLGYRPFYLAHKALAIAFWTVVLVSIAYNSWKLLNTTVLLPAA
jgi:hypothetical protein